MSTTSSKNVFVEQLTPNEVISALWSNSAVEKCRLGLADTLIYENGLPTRWYLTGSSGEVKLKRTVDVPSLSRRWVTISEQLSTNYVAAIRQEGGIVKYLTQDAWDSFVVDKKPDPAIHSVHSFLGTGSKSIVYRSNYVFNLRTNRFITSTQTFTVPTQDPMYVSYEDRLQLHESKASAINKVTDLATTTIVRYIEKMLKIQLLEFSVDYVIDKKSQIWMMWSTKCNFHRGDKSIDRPLTAGDRSSYVEVDGAFVKSSEQEAHVLSQQLKDMAQTSMSRKEPHAAHISAVTATHTFTSSELSPVGKTNNFPNPFSCHGDYCQLDISTVGKLAIDSNEASKHMAHKLFTEEEILKLRKDPRFNKMMEFGSTGVGLAELNMRSINLARREKRGIQNTTIDSKSWREYPVTASKIIQFPNTEGSLDITNRSIDNSDPDALSSTVRDGSEGGRFEEPPENMMLHYEQVRVCGVCYNVYQCLDWARGLLNKRHNDRNKTTSPSRTTGTFDPNSSSISSVNFDDSGIQEIKLGDSAEFRPSRQSRGSRRGGRNPETSSPVRSHSSKDLRGSKNNTWKSQINAVDQRQMKRSELAVLDNYIRGKPSASKDNGSSVSPSKDITRSMQSLSNTTQSSGNQNQLTDNMYIGCVLVACGDGDKVKTIKSVLEEAFFRIVWVKDGREASNAIIESWDTYDCMIMDRDVPLMDSFELSKTVRAHEKKLRIERTSQTSLLSQSNKFMNHRMPLICYTSATAPADLTKYMRADMDGCISDPIDKVSLINTVRAAVPQHLAPLTSIVDPPPPKNPQKVTKVGLLGELENSVDSASMALKTLPIIMNDAGSEFQGIAQLDADTKIPFLVINGSKYNRLRNTMTKERFFNLVVCHDIFDTFERVKIFLQPLVQRYQAIQILVWNYPGQSHTEWRPTQPLNNEYLAACLNELLGQIGEHGTHDFSTDHPFYLMGFGYGANIASYYLANYRAPNIRGLISANGWAFTDSYLAGVMHDCINVFQSTPDSRPDLPVYFFSRFLFSKDYLAKVSVPLALNIYTAVYNAITVKGRIQLCNGVLKSVDVRPLLKAIDVPMICLHSNQDSFARPMHVEPFVSFRFGEVRSIYDALHHPNKTCVVWFSGGHELFQENRKQTLLLLEQILTGYHEVHEVTFPSAAAMSLDPKFSQTLPGGGTKNMGKQELNSSSLEDKFTKSVLSFANIPDSKTGTLMHPGKTQSPSRTGTANHSNRSQSPESSVRSGSRNGTRGTVGASLDHTAGGFNNGSSGNWQEFSDTLQRKQQSILTMDTKTQNSKTAKPGQATVGGEEQLVNGRKKLDIVSELSHLAGADVQSYPEVKEYMSWRLKRNKKRLQRLQQAAQSIQGAFRAYLARKFVKNIRRIHAACSIQRVFRGWLGRKRFFNHVKKLWGAIMLQKNFRGYSARLWYFNTRLKIAAAANIQRMYRGYRARMRVKAIKAKRNKAAMIIQAMMRRYKARKEAWLKRLFRNCSITIQRIFRGYLGKKRAAAERDKYIFSKSQSQGIEFGRQMLLEHKLHVTRLQSDVTLLTQEKVTAEEQIEALLEEITAFEEGVRSLEKEMHQLSKVESEAAAFMDEDSKFELREQKMRLDREFGEMLSKIANRKDMLSDLEKKLAAIDKSRQAKEEDLRTLERKLVVLLEDQQKELNAIRRKQDVRGAMLAASHAELAKTATADGVSGGKSVASSGASTAVGAFGGGGGGSGPSLQEKKQAAQLMQSTETLMKFGFMSMSMTYFSSLNMIKAMRTVSAQDTVMAALADVHAQRAVGYDEGSGSGGGGSGSAPVNQATKLIDKDTVVGRLKKGQLPGQQPLQVSSWSVEDVAKWLQTLSLGQYCEAFIDAAVDGEFLYDLNDDDLKNTLGIEHRLHRKKILNCVNRLKMAEAQNESRLGYIQQAAFNGEAPSMSTMPPQTGGGGRPNSMPAADSFNFPDGTNGGPDSEERNIEGPKIPLAELFSFVRHSKFSLIKDAIDYLANKPFDKSLVQAAYVPDHGTAYLAGYERLPFHINKTDDHGNTMLGMACQNGNMKICKYLISKGANPNHQNFQGQTPAHFAIAFQFFDLSQWLFENGGDDTIENKFGLTPYDGLTADGGTEEMMLAIEG